MPTSESNKRVLRLDPRDNALVALTDLRQGEHVNFAGENYLLLSDVPAKHKFLTQDLPADGNVTMYGVLVEKTSQPLRRGDLLSTRNLRHAAQRCSLPSARSTRGEPSSRSSRATWAEMFDCTVLRCSAAAEKVP